MPMDQARQVLNIESRLPLSAEDISRNFTKYYDANDPERWAAWAGRDALSEWILRERDFCYSYRA